MRVQTILFIFCASITFHPEATAQESTVYATVISNKLFIVGDANPMTGLYYQKTSDTSWQHLGWTKLRANDVDLFAQTKGKDMYVASGNGLLKSTDHGAHWRVTTDWKITEVLCVCVDQRNQSRVFIATAYGIFKSTDGCSTWIQSNVGLGSTFTSSVIFDKDSSNILYCSTEDGVYKSTNSGDVWIRMNLSIGDIRVVSQSPHSRNVLAVGTENNGIYMSSDAGETWTKKEAGIDHTTFYAVIFDPTNSQVMYAGGFATGVYKSIDQGQSWKRMNAGLEHLNVHGIAVDPLNNNRIYAGTIGGGVYRSNDGGLIWKNVGLDGSQVWSITIQPF